MAEEPPSRKEPLSGERPPRPLPPYAYRDPEDPEGKDEDHMQPWRGEVRGRFLKTVNWVEPMVLGSPPR